MLEYFTRDRGWAYLLVESEARFNLTRILVYKNGLEFIKFLIFLKGEDFKFLLQSNISLSICRILHFEISTTIYLFEKSTYYDLSGKWEHEDYVLIKSNMSLDLGLHPKNERGF